MEAFYKMTLTETKLFLREPIAVFFNLAFPTMILLIFASIFGSEQVGGGLRAVDFMAPAYTGFVIGSIGLIGLPINLAEYRQRGILRRLRATPVHPWTILTAQEITQLLMTALGIALLLAVARVAYGLNIPEAPLAVIPAFVFASLSFFAVGFVIAGLTPTVRVAQITGQVIFFPMLFLSGAAGIPREQFPDTVKLISDFLPLTYVVELIQDLWIEGTWNLPALAVLAGVLVAAALISARTFRWE
ncbi:MAG: ABC transporter permease [Rubrobacteraceae bacterium]